MTSSNGKIFRVTGLLCGEFTGPVNSPHKGQWRGTLMFSLISARINGWVNNREAGDLRRILPHYDVIVMFHYKSIHGGAVGNRALGVMPLCPFPHGHIIHILCKQFMWILLKQQLSNHVIFSCDQAALWIERCQTVTQFEFTDGFDMMHKAWCSIEEVSYWLSRSFVKFQGNTGQKIANLARIDRFRTVIPVWIHRCLLNDAQRLT